MSATRDGPAELAMQRRSEQNEVMSNGFVAISRFVVANGKTAEVKDAFRSRPHLVEEATGFLRLDVLSPVDRPDEIWLVTYWADEASYEAWHKSHLYRDSHKGIPKGLKLVPEETQLTFFEHVSS